MEWGGAKKWCSGCGCGCGCGCHPPLTLPQLLLPKGLNAAMYLMLLRFLHRDYDEVYRLTDSIATDTAFGSEGMQIFKALAYANDDWHPDAHACRLKVSSRNRPRVKSRSTFVHEIRCTTTPL